MLRLKMSGGSGEGQILDYVLRRAHAMIPNDYVQLNEPSHWNMDKRMARDFSLEEQQLPCGHEA